MMTVIIFFSSVFTDDNKIMPIIQHNHPTNSFRPKFTPEDVLNSIRKVKSSSTLDPEGFCTYFLKQIQHNIIHPQ